MPAPSSLGRFVGLSIAASGAIQASAQSSFVPLAAKTFDYVRVILLLMLSSRVLLLTRCLHQLALPSRPRHPVTHRPTPTAAQQPDGIPYRVDTDNGPRGTQQGYNVSVIHSRTFGNFIALLRDYGMNAKSIATFIMLIRFCILSFSRALAWCRILGTIYNQRSPFDGLLPCWATLPASTLPLVL